MSNTSNVKSQLVPVAPAISQREVDRQIAAAHGEKVPLVPLPSYPAARSTLSSVEIPLEYDPRLTRETGQTKQPAKHQFKEAWLYYDFKADLEAFKADLAFQMADLHTLHGKAVKNPETLDACDYDKAVGEKALTRAEQKLAASDAKRARIVAALALSNPATDASESESI